MPSLSSRVGNRPAHFQNPVVAPATQRELRDRGFEQIFGRSVHVAIVPKAFRLELRVAGKARTAPPFGLARENSSGRCASSASSDLVSGSSAGLSSSGAVVVLAPTRAIRVR